jgi:arylsulfatase A-like enzyme/Tfp pilus assembly protein PilF
MLTAVTLGALSLLWLRSAPAQADLVRRRGQNVLIVTIDTLRADALSVYGGPAKTPALDALARGGVRFTFAHAHAVLTLPSHTSILTGLYPYQHGVRENSGYRVAPGAPTMATLLKRAGYATGAFIGGFPLHARFGLNQGFDLYDDRFGETGAPTEFVMPERPASSVVPLARAWIAARSREASPWFAWVHLFDPHAPYRPPPPFDAEYASRPYYGEVASADHELAPLLDDVRAASRQTFVLVTGDHGESLGEHGEATHGLFAYEATLRIPLIMAELGGGRPGAAMGQGSNASGEVCAVPVRHVDLLPTVLDAVGEPIPPELPGHTLLPPGERRGATPRPSYFEAMSAMLNRGWAPLQGVVMDLDKYIDLPIPERYDLARDPSERSNLAGRADGRDRMLQAMLRKFGASWPGERPGESAETLSRLRALGYVSGSAPAKARYTEADDPKRLLDLDRAIHHGVELYGDRRFEEAARLYRDLIDRHPDLALAYQYLAFIEWETGRLSEAVALLQRADRAGLRHAELTTQLGTYLAESGQAPEAIRLLGAIEKDAGPDPDALNALGIAYARGGRTADARRVFERVLTLSPESNMALENLGAIDLERGDLAAAKEHFERAVVADPRSSQAQAGLGVVALKQGDRQEAIVFWTRAVQLNPTNYDALYNLATTLAREGQGQAARPYIEQFIRSAPPALYGENIRELSRMLAVRQ